MAARHAATGLDLAARELIALGGGERLALRPAAESRPARAPRALAGRSDRLDGVHHAARPRRRARAARGVRGEPAARGRRRRLHRLRGRRDRAQARARRHADRRRADQPMTALGPEVGARCADLHRAHGVDLRLGTGVDGLRGRTAGSRRCGSPTARASRPTSPSSRSARSPTRTGSSTPASSCSRASSATRRSPRATPSDVFAAGDAAAWPHPMADGGMIRIEHWTNAAEQGAAAARNLLAAAGGARSRTRRSRTSGPTSTTSRSSRSGCPARAERVDRARGAPDGAKLVLGGERDGRLVAAIAFNAPRRLLFYRRQLAAMPPIDDVVAAVRADEKALATLPESRHEGARPHARRLGPARAAGGVARRARDPVRPAPHLRRRADARPGRLRVRRLARLEPQPARHRRPRRRGRARPAARRDRRTTSRCSASASAARRSPPRSAREVETAPQPELGWTDDRDRRPRADPAPARGSSGTSTASPSRRARPRSPAPAPRRRRSATAATSASSSTRRARSRSSPAGRRPTRERLAALGLDDGALIAATDEERAAARAAAFAFFDGFLANANDPAAPAAAVREG